MSSSIKFRVCKKCNSIKQVHEFSKMKRTYKDTEYISYRHTCDTCYKTQRKEYYKQYYKRKKNIEKTETIS